MGAFDNRPILGKKEKIFLTGHTGFKGTWLTLLLEEMGHEVVGYSLNPTPNSLFERLDRSASIQEFIADIRDVDNLKKAMVTSHKDIDAMVGGGWMQKMYQAVGFDTNK